MWDLRMPKVPVLELPGHAHWYALQIADDAYTVLYQKIVLLPKERITF